MTASEEHLAHAAANGDAIAFAALLERVYERVFALAFRMTGRRADAEDLTQDICAALPGKLAGFRGEARFSTWLYRVTMNAAHDRRRRAQRHARAASEWGEVETLRRAEADAAAQAQDWLARTMAALPEELRDTLALTVTEGVTQGQAAEILGVSEGTVAWRMSEVKRRLREIAAAEEMT